MTAPSPDSWSRRVRTHLEVLYPGDDHDALAARLVDAVGIDEGAHAGEVSDGPVVGWTERDVALITYADSVRAPGAAPLATLREVWRDHLADVASIIHVLPYFPWSSDDGFAVVDHSTVDPALGDWSHIEALGRDVAVMSDLVINHASASSPWFAQFLAGEPPGRDYFVTVPPGADVSEVVRPRTHPLVVEVDTAIGPRDVWCTFGADQVDLDVANPDVLVELLRIVDTQLRAGVRLLRLDAVAYLWKELGTRCINLPQTHEVVKLLRTLLEVRAPGVAIVTETNVPLEENLGYLGDGDEAHVVYNFSFPPLVVHALVTGTSDRLVRWLATMATPPEGTTFLNFVASHDGIGLRPAEGLLDEADIEALVSVAAARGGLVSHYDAGDGPRPYELNVTLLDALSATPDGPDEQGIERLAAAHAVMFAMTGLPAVYIHSLLGTRNDLDGVARAGHNRAINRRKLDLGDLRDRLADPTSDAARCRSAVAALVAARRHRAFAPASPQRVVDAGSAFVALQRTARDGSGRVLCLTNVTAARQEIPDAARAAVGDGPVHDLLGGADGWPDALAPYRSVWLAGPET